MNNAHSTASYNVIGRAVLARIINSSNQQDSLVRGIAEQVGYAIIEGQLAAGTDLNSVDLSHQFNTSRTPVREALLLLEKEGLVEIPPRRRARVRELSIEEVRDIYEVRANLYGLVAELIVARASDEAIGTLEPYKDQMVAAARVGDLEAYFWANVAFQDAEIDICGNRQVKRTLDSLMLRMLKLRYLSLTHPGRLEQSLADHERLIRAYHERDAALAVALKKGIVQRGLAMLERSGWAGLKPRSQVEDRAEESSPEGEE
jgi:DNA-binding GntR family transcriptional regulator